MLKDSGGHLQVSGLKGYFSCVLVVRVLGFGETCDLISSDSGVRGYRLAFKTLDPKPR